MSSSLPSQVKVDVALNLEGPRRRSSYIPDKAELKAKGDCDFRIGDNRKCSRLNKGRVGLRGKISSKAQDTSGQAHGIYTNAYEQARDIYKDAYGKAKVADAYGDAAKLDGEKLYGGHKAFGEANVAPTYGKVAGAGGKAKFDAFAKPVANGLGDPRGKAFTGKQAVADGRNDMVKESSSFLLDDLKFNSLNKVGYMHGVNMHKALDQDIDLEVKTINDFVEPYIGQVAVISTDGYGKATKTDAGKLLGENEAYGEANLGRIYGKDALAYREATIAAVFRRHGLDYYGSATDGGHGQDLFIGMAVGDDDHSDAESLPADDDEQSRLSLRFSEDEDDEEEEEHPAYAAEDDAHQHPIHPHGHGDLEDNNGHGSLQSLNANDILSPRSYDSNPIRQARITAAKAHDFLLTFEASVKKANAMLVTMKKSKSVVSDEAMVMLRTTLIDDMQLLLLGLLTRDKKLLDLREEVAYLEGANLCLQNELDGALKKIKTSNKTPGGLAPSDISRLDTLGFKSVRELINGYTILQDKLETDSIIAGNQQAISRATSRLSIYSQLQPCKSKKIQMQDSGLTSNLNKPQSGIPLNRVLLPMPEKFKGKSRIDLERFLKLYEASTVSRGWNDTQRATYLGQYLPEMQLYHDSLCKRNASFEDMKKELLNTLGSNTAATTFSLRSNLDRIKKPSDKSYKQFFKEVEPKVTEAYGTDAKVCDDELKKILLRITEDDTDPHYCSTAIQNANESFFKIKELLLSFESAQLNRKATNKLDKEKGYGSSSGADSRRRDYRDDRSGTSRERFYRSSEDKSNSAGRDENCKSSEGRVSYEKQEKPFANRFENGARSQDNKSCYTCNKSGHFSFECPQKQQGNSNVVSLDESKHCVFGVYPVDKAGTDVTEDIPFFGKQCKMDVLFDGIKVNALLDSGACASVIKDTVIGKILSLKAQGKSGIREVKREAYARKKLFGADGNRLKVVNCVTIPIAWGRYPTKLAKFFVVQGLSQDVLIGTNVLQEGKNWLGALSYVLQEKKNDGKGGDLNVIHLSSVNGGKNIERPSVAKVKKSTKDCQAGKEKKLNESRLGVAVHGTNQAGSKTAAVAGSTNIRVIDAVNPIFKRKEDAHRKAQHHQTFSGAKDYDRDRAIHSNLKCHVEKPIAGRTWCNSNEKPIAGRTWYNPNGRAHQSYSVDRGICSDAMKSSSIIKHHFKSTRDSNRDKTWSKKKEETDVKESQRHIQEEQEV